MTPLTDDRGTWLTEPNAWESHGADKSRRGVTVHLLYLGYHDTAVSTGKRRSRNINRTIITVRTKSGNLSFLPSDLEKGPILAPEYGFFVAASDATTAARFRKELQAKGLKTLREQIHARPERRTGKT